MASPIPPPFLFSATGSVENLPGEAYFPQHPLTGVTLTLPVRPQRDGHQNWTGDSQPGETDTRTGQAILSHGQALGSKSSCTDRLADRWPTSQLGTGVVV